MNQIIWKNRLCIILEDGQWAMSRVGAWTNFDFFTDPPDGKQAVAGNFNPLLLSVRTTAIVPIDDNRLLFIQGNGDVFLMIGDPCDGGRVELLTIPVA